MLCARGVPQGGVSAPVAYFQSDLKYATMSAMIVRNLAAKLVELATRHPVVTVTGPRQSGKTTLCRAAFPDYNYISLERPDIRERARVDPLGLLADNATGLILDEVQHVPELLSYIQVDVDQHKRPGRFVLTGSQHFGLLASVSQSLAGRSAFLHLLPPSWDELQRFPDPPAELWTTVWTGAYPAIHDRRLPPDEWLAGYVASYAERDVRQVLEVQNLRGFQVFLRLAAGRTGQVLNLSGLAADVGVSVGTIKSWVSVLETSFLVALLPAWHRNVGKRLIKSPKLHFLDTGLCCWLLGVSAPEELATHSARGAIFESWVASEILKSHYHRGLRPRLYHLRTRRQEEIDLVLEDGQRRIAVEVKSGQTVVSETVRSLNTVGAMLQSSEHSVRRLLVYGGREAGAFSGATLVPWRDLHAVKWQATGSPSGAES